MGKISQEVARSAANKIVEPIQKKINEVNKEIKELLTGYYRETISLDVMKFWSKHKEYMQSTNYIYIRKV